MQKITIKSCHARLNSKYLIKYCWVIYLVIDKQRRITNYNCFFSFLFNCSTGRHGKLNITNRKNKNRRRRKKKEREKMRITRSSFVASVCSTVSLTIIILPETIRYDIHKYDMYTHTHLLTGCVCPMRVRYDNNYDTSLHLWLTITKTTAYTIHSLIMFHRTHTRIYKSIISWINVYIVYKYT